MPFHILPSNSWFPSHLETVTLVHGQGGVKDGARGISCVVVLLPSVQQKDGDADRTGCFVYTMYTKHRSLLFVHQ